VPPGEGQTEDLVQTYYLIQYDPQNNGSWLEYANAKTEESARLVLREMRDSTPCPWRVQHLVQTLKTLDW